MKLAKATVITVQVKLNALNVLIHITCYYKIAYLLAQLMDIIMKVHILLKSALVTL